MTIRQHIEAKLTAAVIELRDHCRRQDPTATDDEIAQAINIQLRAWYARNNSAALKIERITQGQSNGRT